MLSYIIIYYMIFPYIFLYFLILYYLILYYIILYYIVLYYIVLYYIILYYIILYYIILYLYYIILYYIILYYIILYYIYAILRWSQIWTVPQISRMKPSWNAKASQGPHLGFGDFHRPPDSLYRHQVQPFANQNGGIDDTLGRPGFPDGLGFLHVSSMQPHGSESIWDFDELIVCD